MTPPEQTPAVSTSLHARPSALVELNCPRCQKCLTPILNSGSSTGDAQTSHNQGASTQRHRLATLMCPDGHAVTLNLDAELGALTLEGEALYLERLAPREAAALNSRLQAEPNMATQLEQTDELYDLAIALLSAPVLSATELEQHLHDLLGETVLSADLTRYSGMISFNLDATRKAQGCGAEDRRADVAAELDNPPETENVPLAELEETQAGETQAGETQAGETQRNDEPDISEEDDAFPERAPAFPQIRRSALDIDPDDMDAEL